MVTCSKTREKKMISGDAYIIDDIKNIQYQVKEKSFNGNDAMYGIEYTKSKKKLVRVYKYCKHNFYSLL